MLTAAPEATATADPIPPPAAIPALRTDNLVDSVAIVLVLMLVQRLVGLVRAILFCRYMDPPELGRWDIAQGFFTLAAPLSVLAVSSGLGRYVEHFRQRGQMRAFLARVAAACLALSAIASAAIWLFADQLSQLIFDAPGERTTMLLVAVGLVVVVAFNYFTELFTALRNARAVAVLQVGNSVAFALFGAVFLFSGRTSAPAAVAAFDLSYLVTVIGSLVWLARRWRQFPADGPALPGRQLWSKLLPFTLSVWLTSMVANLFDVVDRTMIVHLAPGTRTENLATAGDYHSARFMPLLLFSAAAMMGNLLTPHLTHDWEAGRKQQVSARLNLFLKMVGSVLVLGGLVAMVLAPVLFRIAFHNKFAGGEAVLPLSLSYCIWFGMFTIAQNYLWCLEKARLATAVLAIGLLTDVALNFLLLPMLGLQGAVLARSIAVLFSLVLVLAVSCRFGLKFDGGVWLILALPALFPLGIVATLGGVALVVFEATLGTRVFSAEEKRTIRQGVAARLRKPMPKVGNEHA